MPLWLDLLRTPMAAPESRQLRGMRFIWQGLCLASALCIEGFATLRRLTGPVAPCAVATLLLLTGLYSWLYLARKQAADTEFPGKQEEEA